MRVAAFDRLRIIIVLLLVPYHVARGFDSVPFYFKNRAAFGDTTCVWELASRTFDIFAMPTLFLIAGYAFSQSLVRRSVRSLMTERLLRLGVPLIFGTFCLMPIVGWTATHESMGFLDYLPRFFEISDLSGFDGRFTPGHLWFLVYLLIFTLVGLAFKTTVSHVGERAEVAPSWVWILLPALVLGATRLIGLPYPSPAYFICFFLMGQALGSTPSALIRIETLLRPAALIACMLVPAYLYIRSEIVFGSGRATISEPWAWAVFEVGIAFAAWVLSLSLVGVTLRFLNGTGRSLNAWSEAAMIVYVSHMAVIVPLGSTVSSVVGSFPFGDWVLTVISSYLILAIIVYGTRRVGLLSFIFGLSR